MHPHTCTLYVLFSPLGIVDDGGDFCVISFVIICLFLTSSVLGILIWAEWLGPQMTGFLYCSFIGVLRI